MFRNFVLCVVLFLGVVHLYGCVPLTVGAVTAGAGSAVWYSHKLVTDLESSSSEVEGAVRSALEDLKMPVTREVRTMDSLKLQSRYGGERVWIDLHDKPETGMVRMEIRVGIPGDQTPSRVIYRKVVEKL